MQVSFFARLLWAAGFAELLVLVFVLMVRRRWQAFPFFTTYIIFQTVEIVALYGIYRWSRPRVYFWAYWAGDVLDLLLQLCVVFELARIVLKPTGTWVRDARVTFMLLAAGGAVIAAVVSFGINPTLPTTLDNWIEKGDLFSAMLNAQLFFAMGLASTRLGLAWRHHVMGIASGWMLWASVGLLVEAAYSYLGPNWHGVILDNIRILAFQAATIYWIINLWLPEPKERTLSPQMQTYLLGLQQNLAAAVQGISSLEKR
ncbi:MAG: hypothetical protein WCC14_15425 [Acidobacteriaceae bacterium]